MRNPADIRLVVPDEITAMDVPAERFLLRFCKEAVFTSNHFSGRADLT